MRVTLLLLTLSPLTASACLWDHDTLRQERARFPETLELLTGKFLCHSPAFYEWRVRDRLEKLKADPSNLALHDDLAVAYQKTGRHELAVQTMLAAEKLNPRRYETNANLGTFYILNGELEKGLPYIDAALAINPDAHFGREKYQKWLVEYAISKKKDGKLTFPVWRDPEGREPNFAGFLTARLGKEEPLTLEDSQTAVKAVLGMMRFANHVNPLLLEALGDLLLCDPMSDAKRLAGRAYLKASYETTGLTADAYRERAGQAIRSQAQRVVHQISLEEVEAEFKTEQADADRWFADLREKERSWIEAGLDADAEFDKLYPNEPAVPHPPAKARTHPGWLIAAWAGLVVAAGAAAYLGRRWLVK